MQLKKYLVDLYERLARINDSNQKIALGMGLGVFLGVLPGAGPIISLIVAAACRLNKAAALLGCLLTNTWISFVIAIPAIKIGALIFNIQWQNLWKEAESLLAHFSFSGFFNLTALKIIVPVLAGYLVAAFFLGCLAYLATFFMLKVTRKNYSERRQL